MYQNRLWRTRRIPVITSLRLFPAVSRVDRSASVSENYVHLEEMSWTVIWAAKSHWDYHLGHRALLQVKSSLSGLTSWWTGSLQHYNLNEITDSAESCSSRFLEIVFLKFGVLPIEQGKPRWAVVVGWPYTFSEITNCGNPKTFLFIFNSSSS